MSQNNKTKPINSTNKITNTNKSKITSNSETSKSTSLSATSANTTPIVSTNKPTSNIKTTIITTVGSVSNTAKKYSAGNIVTILAAIIILISFIYFCYWVYNWYYTNKVNQLLGVDIIKNIIDGKTQNTIGGGSIPSSSYSNEYSISMWMRVDDYSYKYGQEKVILRRGESGSGNPEIVLLPISNDLQVRVQLQSNNQVSHFTDIPDIVTKEISGVDEPHDVTNTQSHWFLDSDDAATAILPKSISSNIVDYPTVKYYDDTPDGANTSNYINVKNDKSMIVLNNPVLGKIVEAFECACGVGSISDTNGNTHNNATGVAMQPIVQSVYVSSSLPNQAANAKDKTNNNSVTTNTYPQLPPSLEGKCTSIKIADPSCCNKQDDTSKIIASQPQTTKPQEVRIATATLPNQNIITELSKTEVSNPVVCPDSKSKIYQDSQGQTFSCPLEPFTVTEPASTTITTTPQTTQQHLQLPQPDMCIVKHFPLQKWVNLIVSVFNQTIDIYIDGKLVSSCVLKGFPKMSKNDIQICPDGGFSGQISRITFFNSAMNAEMAHTQYMKGPISSENLIQSIPSWVYYITILVIILVVAYVLL